jgi:hypothetical protein
LFIFRTGGHAASNAAAAGFMDSAASSLPKSRTEGKPLLKITANGQAKDAPTYPASNLFHWASLPVAALFRGA